MTPLRRVRSELGYTQHEVATGCKIHPTLYSRFETGKKIPTPENAAKLCNFLGGRVTEMELLYPGRYSRPLPKKTKKAA